MNGVPDPELVEAVEALSQEVQSFKRQVQINKVWRNALTGLVTLKAVTIIILIYTIVQVVNTQHREDTIQHDVLCPVYHLFVQSVDAPRAPGETDAAYAARIGARSQIHTSYDKLHCA